MASQQNKVEYPENLKVRAKLEHGDGALIAEKSGFSLAYISDILSGRRRMVDKVKKAIVELLNERQQLDNAIDQIINQ
jgi:hypothetical protein